MALASVCSFAQQIYDPDIKGLVTRIALPNEIDVSRVTIRLDAQTKLYQRDKGEPQSTPREEFKPRLGQIAEVWGKVHGRDYAIDARQVTLAMFRSHPVSGSGVVDVVMEAPVAGGHMLRADGYPVLIPASVVPTVEPPLKAGEENFRTNIWLKFHGVMRLDGAVVADKVHFSANALDEGDIKFRDKGEYDPATAGKDEKQGQLSRYANGIDPRKVPPFHDEEMQARLSRVGERLVPAYQKALPDSDPTKIHFRFQLVAEKWRTPYSWESGIVLVPQGLMLKLPDDADLAAVLAVDVAEAIEKAGYRLRPQSWLAKGLSQVGGLALPGAGLSSYGALGPGARQIIQRVEAQAAREALVLMRDAGYDVNRTPSAWKKLFPVERPFMDGRMNPWMKYQYEALAELCPPR